MRMIQFADLEFHFYAVNSNLKPVNDHVDAQKSMTEQDGNPWTLRMTQHDNDSILKLHLEQSKGTDFSCLISFLSNNLIS